MERLASAVHHAYMVQSDDGPGHYLRAWRESLDLSLENVAARIVELSADRALANPEGRPLRMTHATLSRIERGKLPYNQHLLEVLAEIYKTDPASLLMRDPSSADAIWSIWSQLSAPQKTQVIEIAKTIKRTGTDG